jgi:hypothetical protein
MAATANAMSLAFFGEAMRPAPYAAGATGGAQSSPGSGKQLSASREPGGN